MSNTIPKLLRGQSHRVLPVRDRIPFTRFMSSNKMTGPVQLSVESKLKAAFFPVHLEVINESHMHNVPINSETHFKVIVVSNKFSEMRSPLERHRCVNTVLAKEVASDGPIHALSIVAKSPEQWESMKLASSDGVVHIQPSPNCRGGDGSLPSRH